MDKIVEDSFFGSDLSAEERERMNQTHERAEASRREKAEEKRKKELRTKTIRKYLVIVAVVLVLVFAVFGGVLFQIRDLKQQKAQLEKNIETMQQEIDKLEEKLENVTSPEYIEEQARSLLHMIYPGEKLVIIDE